MVVKRATVGVILMLVLLLIMFNSIDVGEFDIDRLQPASLMNTARDTNTVAVEVEAVGKNVQQQAAQAGTGSITEADLSAQGVTVKDVIYTVFSNAGFNDNGIAGIMGNCFKESTYDPAAVQQTNGLGYGLFQWSSEGRKRPMLEKMREKCHMPQITDQIIDNAMNCQYRTDSWKQVLGNYNENLIAYFQCNYLLYEMESDAYQRDFETIRGAGAYERMKNASSVREATLIFHDVMERSSDDATRLEQRVTEAEARLGDIQNDTIKKIQGTGTTQSSTSSSSSAPASGSAAIEAMIAKAEEYANNDRYGYRYDGYGLSYNDGFDCSGFVSRCISDTIDGCNVGHQNTRSMVGALTGTGKWTQISTRNINFSTGEGLERGDVLVNEGSHTEIYMGNGMTIGAHDNWDGNPGDGRDHKEICPVQLSYGSWGGQTKVVRYTGR